MFNFLLFSVRPLCSFNFQAREQPAHERVCRRLTGSAIDHNSFGHKNESSFASMMMVDIFILESSVPSHGRRRSRFCKALPTFNGEAAPGRRLSLLLGRTSFTERAGANPTDSRSRE